MNYNHQRLLYLIRHTNNQMFKIGIATDNSRFKQLDKDYSIDWNKSLYFKGENEDITFMEKILHRLFFKNRLEEQQGTGGTEWFSIDCLQDVVDAILFNVDKSNFTIDLTLQEINIHKKITTNNKRPKLPVECIPYLDFCSKHISTLNFFNDFYKTPIETRKLIRKEIKEMELFLSETPQIEFSDKFKNAYSLNKGYSVGDGGGDCLITEDGMYYANYKDIIGIDDNKPYKSEIEFILKHILTKEIDCISITSFVLSHICNLEDIPSEYGIYIEETEHWDKQFETVYIFKKSLINTIRKNIKIENKMNSSRFPIMH